VTAPGETEVSATPDAEPRPRLGGLFVGQFTTAFNDSAYKLLVALVAAAAIPGLATMPHAQREAETERQISIAFVAFTLPLLLLSLPAGALADRMSKRTLLVALKAGEAVLMAAAAVALYVAPAEPVPLLAILGLLGVLAALFSPAKYGIVPQLVPHRRLTAANASLEMWTFLALIAGTAAAGPLRDSTSGAAWLAPLVLAALAAVGFFACRTIPAVPVAGSGEGVAASTAGAWKTIRADRVLWLTILGQGFFWGIASLLGQAILVYDKVVLNASDTMAVLPLAVFGVGVGAGAMAASKLSGHKVEFGLIPLGALGMGVLTALLGFASPSTIAGTSVYMALLGVASGLLVVPFESVIQWRSPADRRGGVIALANVFVFGGVLAGTLGAQAMSSAGFDTRAVLVGAALATIAGTLWALWLLPEALLRLVLVLLTHTFYRVKVVGRANVPETGGALLVPNHVTFVDGFFLVATIDRPVRFLVDETYFHNRWLSPFAKAMGAIPVSSAGGPRVIMRALKNAGAYLDQGEIVCIFPEGQLTRTGGLNPFRRGMERIAKGRSAPIVPVHLDRLWGSIFSREGGRYLTKMPKRIPYRVTVSYGDPLPSGTPLHVVRDQVLELGEHAWEERKSDRPPLARSFVGSARKRPFRFAMADATTPHVSRIKAAAGAVALARALRGRWEGQEVVGVLLPPSVGAALVDFAAALSGRAVVNLNYTAGPAGMGSAVRQAALKTVVTNRVFLERAKIEVPPGVETIWIEDVRKEIGVGARLAAFALAAFAPWRLLETACGAVSHTEPDDLATIIFSSGSTGEPKGVMLSHFNVDANVEAVAQAMRISEEDTLLGILPLFHSFGYLVLWFAANNGLGIVFHPNPLDAAAVGELVEKRRVTILLATPTFLQMYLRRCTPEQFGSLRIVLAGAEKMPERLAAAFEEKFGIRPLEGYGTTECAPAVAVNAPDYRAPGFFQTGSRRGTVGRPLPGVSVRIVDPDTHEPLPPDTPGLLLVRGPNVMRGYVGRDDLTAKAMKDGWYVTGDIAAVDDDGFLRITDRLSRFSKIGGEMVPHGRVEEALHEAAGVTEQTFAVTAVPDEKKGERLAVLTTLDLSSLPPILERLGTMGLPNLFLPKKDAFVFVEKLPVLGTGKLDLREMKRLAAERLTKIE
jgi:acyl-[acyl-carrier-protein]-phospholipid O-acyltransferase/long-chain-fatty-acid--[acyl-carrier-protein] ligase